MNEPERSPPEGADPPAASLRAVQVFLGVALVAVAFAVPARPSPSVEASFGGGDDPCVAQIVGLVEAQVLWFDGTPFFGREDFSDTTHLYVTEAGAPDPTRHVGPDRLDNLGETSVDDPDAPSEKEAMEGALADGAFADMPVLVRSGQFYNFTDANGFTWNVTEAYMDVGDDGRYQAHPDRDPSGDVEADSSAREGTKRFYTWIVSLDETRDDNNIGVPGDIGDGGEYNFATRVNTTKFTNDTREESAQTVTHANSTSTNGTNVCHPDHEHVHEEYEADLWLGRQPDLFEVDCEPAHAAWATFMAQHTGRGDPTENPFPYLDVPEADANLTASYRGGTCAADDATDGGET